jgi:hypothetical protein
MYNLIVGEYFSEILNRETEGLDMEEILINTEVADPNIKLHVPTHAEIITALKQMKNGKAPGVDNITPQALKTI